MDQDQVEKNALDGVAVIGLAGRFPGAENVAEFWENLKAGRESITTFTDEELLAAGVPLAHINDPSYVKKRSLFKQPEMFDAGFFGISPREAELMDPQQRVFLETCWHALEDGGYAPDQCNDPVGVWGGLSTGMSNNTYLLSNVHANPNVSEEDVLQSMLGNENDYLTTRVSYKLNLSGPSVNVQTACSTSLVAITSAFQSLLTYGCDMALAGGVSVSYPQVEGYLYQEGDIASPDGHCRPFDAEAQGTVFGNGVGVVLLKRLEDAVSDGDNIYAVIRGAALNNDGAAKVSFAAPSVDGQAQVIATAQAIADVDPETVTYVECHGTGTPIGDPIEISGLTKAFDLGSEFKEHCALGSVKSNFGHLDSAAGVASFIKTVLCLYHKTLVPTLHFKEPNSNIDLASGPFYICAEKKAWQTDQLPRRAGVSGYGIGGTNAHLVLEEFTPCDNEPENQLDKKPQLLIFSAKTKAALQATLKTYADESERLASYALADIAHTLRVGRQEFSYRAVVVADSFCSAQSRLKHKDISTFATAKKAFDGGDIVFMYSGGGSQYLNMAADLYHKEPVIREVIDSGLAILKSSHNIDLKPVWFSSDNSNQEKLLTPSLQLPAIFVLEIAISRWWMSVGVMPDALVGHSMGENAAACIAGVMSFDDGLGLVVLRGQLFEQVENSGMLSVAASVDDIKPFLTDDLDIATINSAQTCTVAGTVNSLSLFSEKLSKQGIDVQKIPISIAAHSHLLDPILPQFKRYLDSIELQPPKINLMSNLTGTWMTKEQACSPQYWTEHLRNTVRFAECVSGLLQEPRLFVEVGPGKILSSLVRLQAPNHSALIVSSVRHQNEQVSDDQFLLASVGRLWCAGLAINWKKIGFNGNGCHRVSLPGYCFQRKRYFIEPATLVPANNNPMSIPSVETQNMQLVSAQQQIDHINTAVANAAVEETQKMPAIKRKDYIQDRLTDTIEKMSGLDREDIDTKVTFLDMGFDSLFLTQANLKFKKEFGVKITFRQLFEDAPTINALAEFIDAGLPEDALQDKLSPTVTPAAMVQAPNITAALGSNIPMSVGTLGSVDLNQLLALQLQVSNAIISFLNGGAQTPNTISMPISSADATVVGATAQLPQAKNSEKVYEQVVAKGFGPYRPLDTSKGKLNDTARKALDEFIDLYAARTLASKKLSEEQRHHLSDPRSISGFRFDWKEMVYQIVGAGSKGAKVWDIDGNEYLDVTSGFGSNLLGYSLEPVAEAIKAQVDQGFELGTLSPLAKEGAELIHALTGMDRITYTNTGSEALSAAIRAARAITGKDKIAVFYDEYHGIADELLVNIRKSKDGTSQTVPTSPGIPQFLVENVIVLEWDDPNYMDILRDNADDLAALIIEPVQNRNPALKTHKHFSEIRKLTKDENIALIFDEMITGFRLHPGGAQAYFGIEVDMCCYGKIVSAGMSLAVLAGRGEWLDCFDGGPWQFGDDSFPEAGVIFFGGTYTRHPIALAGTVAGLKLIRQLSLADYEGLNQRSLILANQLNEFLVGAGFPARFESRGSIFNLKFNDDNAFARLIFWYMRHKGILIYDRPFFISMAHTQADLEHFKQVVKESVQELQAASIVPPATIDNYYGDKTFVAFSEAQQEVWLATLMSEGASRAFHEQIIYKMEAVLDIDALRYAAQKVIYRHEALRATVSEAKDGLEIQPAFYVPVSFVDLSEESDVSNALNKFVEQHIDEDFDLVNGPLIRFSLVKTAPSCSSIVIAAHHLVIDGWSMGVLLDDLAKYYGNAVDGDKFGAEAVNQLSGVNVMIAEQLDSDECIEAESFWLKQYQNNLPAPPALKLDFSRPKLKTYNGHRIVRHINSELLGSIKRLNSDNSCTMFTSMFSIFCLWLNKLTSQDDLVVGVPVAGQALWDCADMVGHMVSYLPFRVAVNQQASYKEFLATVRDYVLDAKEHQNFTYGGLLKKLPIARDPSQLPLTSIAFNVDQGMLEFDFGGINARYVPCPRNYVKYDIFFNVIDESSGLSLEVDFNSDLLHRETVECWLDQFQQLLVDVVHSTPSKLLDFNLVNDADTDLSALNGSHKDYGLETKTLHGLIEQAVDNYPENIAVQDVNSQLSYAALDSRANQLAHYLIAEGVGPEKLVAICMERSVDMVVAINAVLKAGGAYVPIDPEFPSDRITMLLDQSEAVFVLSQQLLSDSLPQEIAKLFVDSNWSAVEAMPHTRPNVMVTPETLAYVIYTSGSTGKPKGVMVEHRSICNHTLWLNEQFALSPEARVLQKTPYTFDVSLWELFLPLMSGARLILAQPEGHKDMQYLIQTIEQHQITHIHFVASMLTLFLSCDNLQRCASLECVFTSGEAVSKDHEKLFSRCFPTIPLWNLYGPTEAAVHITAWQCGTLDDMNLVPIGLPIANAKAYIVDEQLRLQPKGVSGELLLGGVQVARGYLGEPKLTADKFLADPFSSDSESRVYRTGDRARIRNDGVIEYLGRDDNQIKMGGIRIELGEIEAAINDCFGFAQSVVTTFGEALDQRLAAYYIPKAGAQLTVSEIRMALLKKLPTYLVPQYFVALEHFPLTSSGKLDRKALPEPDKNQIDSSNFLAPESDLEVFIASHWCEVLGVEKVSLNDDFFERGGHSLLGVNLLNTLSRSIELDIPVVVLFEYTRLGDFCNAIENLLVQALEKVSDEDAVRLLGDP